MIVKIIVLEFFLQVFKFVNPIHNLDFASVSIVAGTGIPGYVDGEASEAKFHSPQDMSVSPDGAVLIADKENNCIRRLHACMYYRC